MNPVSGIWTPCQATRPPSRSIENYWLGPSGACACCARSFDIENREARAEGRSRGGWVRSRLGEFAEAEQDYNRAVNVLTQLAATFSTRSELRQELAGSHIHRGVLLDEMGWYRRELKAVRQHVLSTPEVRSDTMKRSVAYTEDSVGLRVQSAYAHRIRSQHTNGMPQIAAEIRKSHSARAVI